jgi:hypothetical protein
LIARNALHINAGPVEAAVGRLWAESHMLSKSVRRGGGRRGGRGSRSPDMSCKKQSE